MRGSASIMQICRSLVRFASSALSFAGTPIPPGCSRAHPACPAIRRVCARHSAWSWRHRSPPMSAPPPRSASGPLAEIETTPRRRSAFARPALDQMTRFEIAQNSRQARPQQKRDARQFRDLDGVDRGQRAQDPPLLFGQAVIAQRGTELPHHRLARAQQRHRQRAGEFAHRHAPDVGLPVEPGSLWLISSAPSRPIVHGAEILRCNKRRLGLIGYI